MSISGAALARLADIDMPVETLREVLRALAIDDSRAASDAAADKRRAYDRQRKAEAAAAKKAGNSTGFSAWNSTGIPPEKPSPSSPNDITLTPSCPSDDLLSRDAPASPVYDGTDIGSEHVRAYRRTANDPKRILGAVLSDETVVDLVAHRKALKAPLTAGAAKGLVREFTKFGDPEAAARAMMARGWRGFDPEWMLNQPRAGPGAPRRESALAIAKEAHEHATLDLLSRPPAEPPRSDESDYEIWGRPALAASSA